MAKTVSTGTPSGSPTDGATRDGAVVRIERGPLGTERTATLAAALALATLGIWLAVPEAVSPPTGALLDEVASPAPGDPAARDDRARAPAEPPGVQPGAPPRLAAGFDSASRSAVPAAPRSEGDALRRAQRPGRTGDGQRYQPDHKTEAEIAALLDAAERGDTTGIGVFPAPGTKPVKSGLIVPEGVELPPGYVRHHQTTDDGQMLPPILAYHPDHTPTDAAGNPLPRPPGGVVPPDQAPVDLRGGEILIPPPGQVAPIQAPGDRAVAR